jgi:ABC-2 type transport system permease protein
MLRNLAAKTLRDSRRALLWWSCGLAGMVALMVAVYPSVRGNASLNKLVHDYPKALKAFIGFGGAVDYTTGAGYLGIELFSLMVPLLLLIAAIGAGARAVAGEEEQGTLELLLATPLRRRRLVLDKLAALVAELMVLAAVLWLALLVGVRAAEMKVSALHLLAATTSAALLALAFGCIALLISAADGHKARALALTSAAAVAAYLVNALAPLVGGMEPVRKASPFYHYVASDPLRHGLEPVHVLALLAIAVVAAALAPIPFERRDIVSPS